MMVTGKEIVAVDGVPLIIQMAQETAGLSRDDLMG
jgi:hypothetical protein